MDWRPCRIGSVIELEVATKIMEAGGNVLFPYGHDQPYDLISDFDGNLKRIQVKKARQLSRYNGWEVDPRAQSGSARTKSKARCEYDFLITKRDTDFFVIPAELILGRSTVSLCEPGRVRGPGGPVAIFDSSVYHEAWDLLKES